jgi:hypothetical protein
MPIHELRLVLAVDESGRGARDLNPGPHGPESRDSSSKYVGFCVFQFGSSCRRARAVQMSTNLQPDYYTKYYRMQVVRTGSSVIMRCDRPGIGRRQQLECHAQGRSLNTNGLNAPHTLR